MTYQYRGHHQGPDLFDTANKTDDALPSPYNMTVRDERNALIAYHYERGLHDREIAVQVGASAKSIQRWRDKRCLQSNFDLLVRA